jgi:hypothetical protein
MYYIDGTLVADHSDKNYPEVPMSIDFNQWFINGGVLSSGEIRKYTMDIDWVYFVEDMALTTDQVQNAVDSCKKISIKGIDTVKTKKGDLPNAAELSVDSAKNNGTYSVTVTVPARNTAHALRLLENGKLVMSNPLEVNSKDAQTFIYSVQNKDISNYTYNAELTNANGTRSSAELVVEVVPGEGIAMNAAKNKTVKGSYIAGDPNVMVDGIKNDTAAFVGNGDGLKWLQIDLGRSYDINRVNIWHYFGDGRTYHDVIVQVSNTEDFSSGVTTVFNNDKDDTAGIGMGNENEYAETEDGKSIPFDTVNARYVRLYSNGSNANEYNHYVEVEVWTAE